MSLLWDTFGAVGLVLLVSAFSANALGRMARDGVAYTGMNLGGSAILGVYSWYLNAPIFVVLEVVWASVALAGLVRALQGRVDLA
ncbi:MAG TPA: hypothetical protein VM681_05060 [Candidatus Thermoplasmatota archaeon]|nr:hypothetical protein [Candidatus Thermoplasmatota archaeon]